MLNTGLAGPDRPFVLLFTPVVVVALGWAWLGYALRPEPGVSRVVESALR